MKKFPKHYSKEILSLAEEGYGPSYIANKFDLKPVSVNGFLRRHGIKQPKPGEDNKNQIIKLYHQGLKPDDISKKLNVNRVTINSLLNRKGLYYNPFVHNETYFSCIDTPNKAYFLGFIAADGALVNNLNNSLVLTISINKKDRIILETFKKEVEADHKIQLLKRRNNSMVRLAFANKTITNDLINLGITERKSKTLTNIITNVPDAYKPAFIIGYFDGDGSVHKHSLNGKTVQLRGTFDFLSGIKEYLGFGNLHFNVTWIFKISRFEQIKTFYNLYKDCDFYLLRKYKKFDECRTISSPYSSINRG